MSNVVLSIDGRKEVNDYFRVLPNGQGCYDMILPKYKKLVEGRGDKEYYVRGTFTNKNLDFSNDVFALYDAGFDQISVEPVVGESDEYPLTEKDLPAVFKEYEFLAKRLLENEKNGKKFNFFHFMLDLDQGPCAIKRLRGCGCGNDYVAVTPDGDIFPCHQFVGIDEYKMGNIDEGTFDQDMKKDFASAHVYSKPDCILRGLFSVMPIIVSVVVSFLTGNSGVLTFIFDGSNTFVIILILLPIIESADMALVSAFLPKSLSPSILMPSRNSVDLLSTMLFSLSEL